MSLRSELRELHGPDGDSYKLSCQGCDFEANYEGEAPTWPCRTAELVYDQDEIDYAVQMYRSWRKWGSEIKRRQKLASGWTSEDDFAQAMHRFTEMSVRNMLKEYERSSALFKAMTDPGAKITFNKVGAIIPMSQQNMEANGSEPL